MHTGHAKQGHEVQNIHLDHSVLACPLKLPKRSNRAVITNRKKPDWPAS